MRSVLEDSVDSFIAEWRRYAVTAWLYSRVEGSALLECEVNGRIFHLFERTNPYASPAGKARLIVHGVAEGLTVGEGEPSFEVLGPSRLRLGGRVSRVSGELLVIDVGFPVVVGLLGPGPGRLEPGDYAVLETLPPLHGFVIGETRVNQPTDGL
jgi:hypothetical protein